jgi:hypothetical protein
MENLATAILFADRKGTELSPLDQFYPPAILPIAGKTPLEYWLEVLCEQGFKKVFIFTSSHSQMIKTQFASGDHWGLELNYLSSRGEEQPSDLIQRYISSLDQHAYAARADILPDPEAQHPLCPGMIVDTHNAQSLATVNDLEWGKLSATPKSAEFLLRKLVNLPRVTNQILESKMAQRTPRGILVNTGQWLATPNFSKDRASQTQGNLYIGSKAMVHKEVNLSGDLCIEAGCFIDRGATLKNALVLPGSYIGQNVSVEDAIVCGSLLISLHHGTAQQIGDPALIAHIDSASNLVRTTSTERMIAATLLTSTALLALPLAWLSKIRAKPLLSRSEAGSNRSSRKHPIEFERLAFNSSIGWVKRWPQLLNVIDGDLKLFGTATEPLNTAPVLPDLPLCQGVFTPGDLFRTCEFDQIEEQLWGLELANENLGVWRLGLRATKAMFLGPRQQHTESPQVLDD